MVQPSVFVPEAIFDRAWGLAAAGMLKFARLSMTTPHYQTEYVVSLSVSSLRQE
jgi:hypothetical protein